MEMKKLANLQTKILAKFGIDKVLHLFGGAIVFLATFGAFLGLSVLLGLSVDWFKSVLISAIVTIVGGVLKEYIYDKKMRGGEFDFKDAFATALGVPFGLFLLALFFGSMWCVVQVLHCI